MTIHTILVPQRKDAYRVTVQIFDNETAKKIRASLPLTIRIETWGDELYGPLDIDAPLSNLTRDVEAGDIAWWPEGKCLCVFFGPTPMSTSSKPVPASDVVIVGKMVSFDRKRLRTVKDGALVRLE